MRTTWTASIAGVGLVGILLLFIFSLTIVSAFPMSEVDGRSFSPMEKQMTQDPEPASPHVNVVTRRDGANPSIINLTGVAGGFRFRVRATPHPNSIDSTKEQLLGDASEDQVRDEPDAASGSSSARPSFQSSTIKLINSEDTDTKNQEILQQSSPVKNFTDVEKQKPNAEPEPVLPEVTEEQVAESTKNTQAKSEFLHRLQVVGILLPDSPTLVTTPSTTTEERRDDAGLVNVPPPFTPELRQQSIQSFSPFLTTYSFTNNDAPLSILGEFHRGTYFTI